VADKLSAVEQLKKLDAERAKILETAKTEALAKATEAIEELNALGFHYSISEGARSARQPRAGGTTAKRQPSGAACPICGFKTEPPHDRRTHRTQEPKRAFNDAELKEKGLVKV